MKKIQKTRISKPNTGCGQGNIWRNQPITETQLQTKDTDLFQKDLQDLAWIDAKEDPWEYCIQQGCIYNT